MLNFDVLQHFVCDFSGKMFIMFYSINWLNFIVWLSLRLEILNNMRIAIVCFSGCDVINFEVNLIFLIKSFFCMTKMSRQKFKYIENEKKLLRWNKKYFLSFLNGFQLPKSFLRPESASLKAHWQISKKWRFEKLCSCDKACQFLAL